MKLFQSGTRHSQTPRAQGASPHRVREQAGFGKINHGGSFGVSGVARASLPWLMSGFPAETE
jgi:hypothetical protein